MDRIATDRRVDAAAGLHDAPDERDVLFLDLAIVKLARELLVRGVVLGDNQHTRCSAIESMNDAGAELAADAAQIRNVVEESVDERSRRVAGSRMHHHAGWLVDDNDVRILMENFKRRRF